MSYYDDNDETDYSPPTSSINSMYSVPPPPSPYHPPTVFNITSDMSFDLIMEKIAVDGFIFDSGTTSNSNSDSTLPTDTPATPTIPVTSIPDTTTSSSSSAASVISPSISDYLAKERFNLPYMINMSRLIAACYTGDLSIVKALVEAGAEVNAEAQLTNPLPGNGSYVSQRSRSVTTTYYNPLSHPSPLRMARYKGHKDVLHYLCSQPKIHYEEAMTAACEFGLDDIVIMLMNGAEGCKCRPSSSHLQTAAQFNHVKVVKALLDPFTGMTYDPLLPPEFRRSHPSHYTLVTSYSLGRALCLAVSEGNAEMVQLLIDNRAPKDGITAAYASEVPLFIAASEGEKALETMKVLIKAGANPNHVSTHLREEASAIRSAVQAENIEGLQYLLSVGAIRGLNTGLSEAAKKGNTQMIEILLATGADWNTTDSQGRTLLYKVTYAGCLPVVETLLQKGADPNTLSPCGEEGSSLSVTRESPLLAACSKGYTAILKVLLAYNADPSFKIHNLRTPLILLASNGNYDGMYALLNIYYQFPTDYPNHSTEESSTDGSNSNSGSFVIHPRTPLQYPPLHRTEIQDALQQCCIVGSLSCIRLLLDIGGEINPVLPVISPLLQCSIYGHEDCIQYLLQKGADITARSTSNKTALDLVRNYGTGPRIRKQRTIEILEQAWKHQQQQKAVTHALEQKEE